MQFMQHACALRGAVLFDACTEAEMRAFRVKQHGCAGCASTGSDAGVFVLVFVGLVLRRRRRAA